MQPIGLPRARWQRAAFFFSIAAFATFLINFAFILWATTKSGPGLENGIGTVFEGETCSQTKRFNTGIHIVINILSTVLLSGSNYCMQCLIAPTRSEIDAAHAKQRWLDIGVPSIRNFGSISRKRKVAWLLLSASSLPLHLLYNSAVFTSTSVNDYMVFLVYDQFVTEENVNLTSLRYSGELDQIRAAFYENKTAQTDHHIQELDPKECRTYYGTPFQSSRGNLLLITGDDTIDEAVGEEMCFHMSNGGASQPFHWMCQRRSTDHGRICDDEVPRIIETPDNWRPFNSKIMKCYSQKTSEHCKLLYSNTLCWVVTSLNLLKGVLMLLVAFSSSECPILTIGDAIASFMEETDETTAGMCLKSKQDFDAVAWGMTLQQFRSNKHRKFATGSPKRWTTCVILYIFALAICLYLLGHGLNDMTGDKTITKLGFGAPHSKTVMDIGIVGQGSQYLLLNAMLVNTPQVIMSLLYFNYNALYTSISLVTEWDRFGCERKGLRVSTKPRKAQRGTYFLQLPYRYSLPLVVFSGILHWLISQSIFLVHLQVYGPSDANVMDIVAPAADDSLSNITTCGWSPLGVVLVVVAGLCMVSFLLVSGWQRLKVGIMPVAGSCSAAISAACHPAASEPYAWEKELQWGVVEAPGNEPGKCSFSSMRVERPLTGQLYA